MAFGLLVGKLLSDWRSHPAETPLDDSVSNWAAGKWSTERMTETWTAKMNTTRRPRVLCWVMTSPKTHRSRAVAVKDTWGPRCDYLLFMSSQSEPLLPTVVLPVGEGRRNLWKKTREAFRYIYSERYLDVVDWVLKADDDTYVVVENLRYLLSSYDPKEALMLGLHLKHYTENGFMSGGAGYVLSTEATRAFVTKAMNNTEICDKESTYEDTAVAKCLTHVGVKFVDSKDELGKQRFFAYPPERHVQLNTQMEWLKNYMYDPVPEGPKFGSSSAVTFHYVNPTNMYVLDYLLYTLHVYRSEFSMATTEYDDNTTATTGNM